MRYVKRQTSNEKNALGKGIIYTSVAEVVMDTQNSMLVPKGPTSARPQFPENGHMRYNTDVEEFEFYQDDQWRKARYKEPRTIVQQTLNGASGTETIFGPLDNQDADYSAPDSAQAMIVLIENVFQISITNYNLVQNPSSHDTGAEVGATALVNGTDYVITSVDDGLGGAVTDFTLVGAEDNSIGTVFTATGPGAGSGTAREAGYYLEFTSNVPLGKPITVLHNFNK